MNSQLTPRSRHTVQFLKDYGAEQARAAQRPSHRNSPDAGRGAQRESSGAWRTPTRRLAVAAPGRRRRRRSRGSHRLCVLRGGGSRRPPRAAARLLRRQVRAAGRLFLLQHRAGGQLAGARTRASLTQKSERKGDNHVGKNLNTKDRCDRGSVAAHDRRRSCGGRCQNRRPAERRQLGSSSPPPRHVRRARHPGTPREGPEGDLAGRRRTEGRRRVAAPGR